MVPVAEHHTTRIFGYMVWAFGWHILGNFIGLEYSISCSTCGRPFFKQNFHVLVFVILFDVHVILYSVFDCLF